MGENVGQIHLRADVMKRKQPWFLLVVALWLLVMLIILLTTPTGAQTVAGDKASGRKTFSIVKREGEDVVVIDQKTGQVIFSTIGSGESKVTTIAGSDEWDGSALPPWINVRVCALSITSRDGIELGCLTPDNKTHLHRLVKTVCQPARFRRNMLAALKGSNKAHRYLENCAAKLNGRRE